MNECYKFKAADDEDRHMSNCEHMKRFYTDADDIQFEKLIDAECKEFQKKVTIE